MSDSIDLKDFYFYTIKNIKSFIYSFIFFVLSFFFYYQFFNNNYVTTNQLLLTQSSLNTSTSAFNAITGMGIDFSNEKNIVNSNILYNLISNDYFFDKLIFSNLDENDLDQNDVKNFYEYYISNFDNSNDSSLSSIKKAKTFYKNSISYYFDPDKKILEVEVSTPNPLLSKKLNESFGKKLNNYITEINQKSHESVFEFLNNELKIKKNEYDQAANNYYSFLEKNQNISKKTLIALEQRLQLEFQLKYELYKNIQIKLQETEIKLKTTYNSLSQLFPINATDSPNEIPFLRTLITFIFSSVLFTYLFLFFQNFILKFIISN